MKKRIFVTGFAAALTLAASAQKHAAPKPPSPPKPPVENQTDVPPPPAPPSEPSPPSEPPPPPADVPQVPNDFDAFMKKNPSVKAVHWKNDELIIRLKSGKEEHYNLADEKSRKDAEAKYGELPQEPPPPPPPPAPPAPPKPPKKISIQS